MKNLVRQFPLLAYINIPVLITLLGIYLAVSALYWVIHQQFELAIVFILSAILADQLDGPVARKLNQVTVFGGYLDVFADFLSYCLFPVVVIYSLVTHSGVVLALVAILPLIGCLRLAYYLESNKKDIVIGTPCCLLILFMPYLEILSSEALLYLSVVYILLTAVIWLSAMPLQANGVFAKTLMLLLFVTGVKALVVVVS